METVQDRVGVIVNRLSRLMGERRLSIQELSRQSGVSYSSVFALYHDQANRFDRPTLDRLCTALSCGVGDILEFVPYPAPATEGE